MSERCSTPPCSTASALMPSAHADTYVLHRSIITSARIRTMQYAAMTTASDGGQELLTTKIFVRVANQRLLYHSKLVTQVGITTRWEDGGWL